MTDATSVEYEIYSKKGQLNGSKYFLTTLPHGLNPELSFRSPWAE